MSSFCVFGMTRSIAKSRATKKVSPKNKTQEQWAADVDAEAERIFNTAKPVKCSNTFDAPQFAKDFIVVAHRGGHLRDGAVYGLYQSGKVNKKSGKKRLQWREYKAA